MATGSTFKTRVAGKWQLPLLCFSLASLAGSVWLSRPRPKPIPLEERVAQLGSLVESGTFGHAAELGDLLLAREDCVGLRCAEVHVWSARAAFGQAAKKGLQSTSIAKRVAEHYRAAEVGGIELTAADVQTLGRVAEWREQFETAVACYERALSLGFGKADDLRREVLTLRRDRFKASGQEMIEHFSAFLEVVSEERRDLRFWALKEQAALLEEHDRADEASVLLQENAARFSDPEFRDRFEFLQALNLVARHEFDEVEVRLRTLRNRVERTDELQAMAGWLLGRVLINDGGPQRPQEALSFFEDVLRNHPKGTYAVASRVGLAEAFAALERHEEAIATFENALEEMSTVDESRVVSLPSLAAALSVAAEAQRRNDRSEVALGYARLAVRLVDREQVETASGVLSQFADLAVQVADRHRGSGPRAVSDDARALYEQAADAYLEIARLNTMNEPRAADASWRAAESCAQAGMTARAVQLFEKFVQERPQDNLVPRAWLRMGQLRHEARQLRAAIAAYQECYRRFPHTLDGARTLVPLARCHLSLGGESLELAERTLQIILDGSEVFTPEAPEFADALFLLGEVRLRRESFEPAISSLEEAVDRYPNDPRVSHTRFLLADAYRRSGLALRAEASQATFDAELEYIRSESNTRLSTARALYRQVIDEYEGRNAEGLGSVDRLQLRHAYLYEADCYFDTRDYVRALKLYEEAAGTYKDQPGGLAAYVQIINCHVFLGESDEARAALARALVLVETIPEVAFATSISPQTRGDWKEYFEWLGETGLF